ncbi:dihydrofolate reductase family protein [Ammonicoccus fulvus]|uniref:Dihydrofolate reductase family protein n=1 Tax=Ammonicoccus fulvus TaxID=3138240 RepID=A0ABZ3FUG5_9ACTN
MSDLVFRRLIGPDSLPEALAEADLPRAYAWPATPTVRVNFLASLDGSVVGADGLSGSLGNEADHAVFFALRRSCDAIVVGAGTARAEGYGPPPAGALLILVSRSGRIPEQLAGHPSVILATGEAGARRARAGVPMGAERIWTFGEDEVRAGAVRDRLVGEGRTRILHEGGPRLLADWLAAGCVDEFCLTRVPRLLGGGRGLLPEPVGDLRLRPELLLETGGTLLGRWILLRQD